MPSLSHACTSLPPNPLYLRGQDWSSVYQKVHEWIFCLCVSFQTPFTEMDRESHDVLVAVNHDDSMHMMIRRVALGSNIIYCYWR
jgi:hypothetical protein